MINLETLVGLLVFLCINLLFCRQIYIIVKNKISNGCLYISIILFFIQIVSSLGSKFEYNGYPQEEFVSLIIYAVAVFAYFIGSHIFGIISIIINQVIISREKEVLNGKQFIKKLINLFSSSKKGCSRSEYWIFFGLSSFVIFILYFIGSYLNTNYYMYFNYENYRTILFLAFGILNIILQVKRLRDANISPFILLTYLLSVLGVSFAFIVTIIIMVLLLLPTQKIPTTDVKRGKTI